MTKPHLLGVLAGLFLAAGLVLAAMLVTRAWLRISESQTVSVTGSARKTVRSEITPIYSSQTSSEGINDTTSLEKTVTAVVTASFSLK